MARLNALRTSSSRCLFAGLGMELGSYLVGMLDSYADWIGSVSAALGIGGALVLVVGICKIGYDVMQLLRGRSPRDAVHWRVGLLEVRLSTVANLASGGAMAGAYFWLSAHHIGAFGEDGDIGGGGLLLAGCIAAALGAAKLVFDLVQHPARGVS